MSTYQTNNSDKMVQKVQNRIRLLERKISLLEVYIISVSTHTGSLVLILVNPYKLVVNLKLQVFKVVLTRYKQTNKCSK